MKRLLSPLALAASAALCLAGLASTANAAAPSEDRLSPTMTNVQIATPARMQQLIAKQIDAGKTKPGYIDVQQAKNGHFNFGHGGGSGGEAMTTKALASPDGDGVQRMSASIEIDDKFTGKHLFGGAIAA